MKNVLRIVDDNETFNGGIVAALVVGFVFGLVVGFVVAMLF